ncbi:recombinase family protein [Undibacterium arcticum]|uniref:recombinase family protein n=1 Tax=Undibacterium arcticum TaxID=1762892 RepID=UPI00360761B6
MATIKCLAERKVEVIVLQLGSLHLDSPAAKLTWAILAAVAEMERDSFLDRIQAGLAGA